MNGNTSQDDLKSEFIEMEYEEPPYVRIIQREKQLEHFYKEEITKYIKERRLKQLKSESEQLTNIAYHGSLILSRLVGAELTPNECYGLATGITKIYQCAQNIIQLILIMKAKQMMIQINHQKKRRNDGKT
jgi:hypothetical protein